MEHPEEIGDDLEFKDENQDEWDDGNEQDGQPPPPINNLDTVTDELEFQFKQQLLKIRVAIGVNSEVVKELEEQFKQNPNQALNAARQWVEENSQQPSQTNNVVNTNTNNDALLATTLQKEEYTRNIYTELGQQAQESQGNLAEPNPEHLPSWDGVPPQVSNDLLELEQLYQTVQTKELGNVSQDDVDRIETLHRKFHDNAEYAAYQFDALKLWNETLTKDGFKDLVQNNQIAPDYRVAQYNYDVAPNNARARNKAALRLFTELKKENVMPQDDAMAAEAAREFNRNFNAAQGNLHRGIKDHLDDIYRDNPAYALLTIHNRRQIRPQIPLSDAQEEKLSKDIDSLNTSLQHYQTLQNNPDASDNDKKVARTEAVEAFRDAYDAGHGKDAEKLVLQTFDKYEDFDDILRQYTIDYPFMFNSISKLIQGRDKISVPDSTLQSQPQQPVIPGPTGNQNIPMPELSNQPPTFSLKYLKTDLDSYVNPDTSENDQKNMRLNIIDLVQKSYDEKRGRDAEALVIRAFKDYGALDKLLANNDNAGDTPKTKFAITKLNQIRKRIAAPKPQPQPQFDEDKEEKKDIEPDDEVKRSVSGPDVPDWLNGRIQRRIQNELKIEFSKGNTALNTTDGTNRLVQGIVGEELFQYAAKAGKVTGMGKLDQIINLDAVAGKIARMSRGAFDKAGGMDFLVIDQDEKGNKQATWVDVKTSLSPKALDKYEQELNPFISDKGGGGWRSKTGSDWLHQYKDAALEDLRRRLKDNNKELLDPLQAGKAATREHILNNRVLAIPSDHYQAMHNHLPGYVLGMPYSASEIEQLVTAQKNFTSKVKDELWKASRNKSEQKQEAKQVIESLPPTSNLLIDRKEMSVKQLQALRKQEIKNYQDQLATIQKEMRRVEENSKKNRAEALKIAKNMKIESLGNKAKNLDLDYLSQKVTAFKDNRSLTGALDILATSKAIDDHGDKNLISRKKEILTQQHMRNQNPLDVAAYVLSTLDNKVTQSTYPKEPYVYNEPTQNTLQPNMQKQETIASLAKKKSLELVSDAVRKNSVQPFSYQQFSDEKHHKAFKNLTGIDKKKLDEHLKNVAQFHRNRGQREGGGHFSRHGMAYTNQLVLGTILGRQLGNGANELKAKQNVADLFGINTDALDAIWKDVQGTYAKLPYETYNQSKGLVKNYDLAGGEWYNKDKKPNTDIGFRDLDPDNFDVKKIVKLTGNYQFKDREEGILSLHPLRYKDLIKNGKDWFEQCTGLELAKVTERIALLKKYPQSPPSRAVGKQLGLSDQVMLQMMTDKHYGSNPNYKDIATLFGLHPDPAEPEPKNLAEKAHLIASHNYNKALNDEGIAIQEAKEKKLHKEFQQARFNLKKQGFDPGMKLSIPGDIVFKVSPEQESQNEHKTSYMAVYTVIDKDTKKIKSSQYQRLKSKQTPNIRILESYKNDTEAWKAYVNSCNKVAPEIALKAKKLWDSKDSELLQMSPSQSMVVDKLWNKEVYKAYSNLTPDEKKRANNLELNVTMVQEHHAQLGLNENNVFIDTHIGSHSKCEPMWMNEAQLNKLNYKDLVNNTTIDQHLLHYLKLKSQESEKAPRYFPKPPAKMPKHDEPMCLDVEIEHNPKGKPTNISPWPAEFAIVCMPMEKRGDKCVEHIHQISFIKMENPFDPTVKAGKYPKPENLIKINEKSSQAWKNYMGRYKQRMEGFTTQLLDKLLMAKIDGNNYTGQVTKLLARDKHLEKLYKNLTDEEKHLANNLQIHVGVVDIAHLNPTNALAAYLPYDTSANVNLKVIKDFDNDPVKRLTALGYDQQQLKKKEKKQQEKKIPKKKVKNQTQNLPSL